MSLEKRLRKLESEHVEPGETGEAGHHEAPEGILRLFAHGHDPGAFLEKGSGLPFLSRAVSGIDIGASLGDAGMGGEGGA